MKYKLLAAIVSFAFVPLAQAQTNLSIYGIVDTGIHIGKNGGGTQYNLASGISDGSRIGFKGTEELGNGYKAVVNLEARFEADNGGYSNTYFSPHFSESLLAGLPGPVQDILRPGTRPARVVNPNLSLFDRTSMLGLVTPAGAVLLGRQYTPGYEIGVMGDSFEAGTAAGWGNIVSGTGGIFTAGVALRASDAIQYRVQTPSGFGASLMYAKSDEASARAGTGTGSINRSKRLWGGNLKYQANGLNVGVGYNSEDNQNGEKSLTTWTLAGSYEFGNAKVFAGYHRMKNDNPAIRQSLADQGAALGLSLNHPVVVRVNENAKLDAESYSIGMQYKIGSGRITTGISHTDDDRPAGAKVTLYGLGYNYYLSKRTDLYAIVAHADNNDAAQYALGGAGYAGGFTSTRGQDATAYQFGIRHRF